jgi:hypothetical protein
MRNQVIGRITIGLLAASPLSVVAVVLIVIVFGFRSATIPLGTIVIALAITTVVMQAGVVGYFLYLVHTDDALDAAGKSRWTYILVMWLPFGAIAYWYQFVWRNRDHARS